jgi:hypothetical protein
MASPSFKLQENTAASLLHYRSFNKPGATEQCWTRYSSADEEFNLTRAGGRTYLIKFEKNFSKKHLATFSKKEWKTSTEAWLQSQKPGQQGKDTENWQAAQKQLLDNKILKTAGIRKGPADADLCARAGCNHPRKDVVGAPNTGHSNSGNCKVPGCLCTAAAGGFLSAYVASRIAETKPLHDPYEGTPAQTSSCIVLNWIPKNEFEDVLRNSILAVDPNNVLPNSPLPGPGVPNPPLQHLHWDFGLARAGAVRSASNGAISMPNGTWCDVGARKALGGPPGVDATWTIVHWQGQG